MTTTPFTPELQALIAANSTEGHRPLLFTNARIITDDPLIGDFTRADILLGGARIVGIGPGLLTAADDDGAIVIDCDGYAIVPAVIDVTRLQGLRTPNHRGTAALSPGNAATFAILPAGSDAGSEESNDGLLHRFLQSPDIASAVIVDGAVTVGNRHRTSAIDAQPKMTRESGDIPESLLGTWIDENDFVHQHLSADGRYDETRGGRPHAFQGSFWVTGDRIDYLDDLGFWAYGELTDGVLHHAGYTFRRA